MEFHERLKFLREESGLTQKKLGCHLNYGSSAIANYESSRNEPSIPDLKKIAACFNVSMDYLLGMSEVRNPYTAEQNMPYFDLLRQHYSKITSPQNEMLVAFADFLTTYKTDSKPVTYTKSSSRKETTTRAAEPSATYSPSKKIDGQVPEKE